MEVTTTGIYGKPLEEIKDKIRESKAFYFNSNLTAASKVLIVGNENSRKFEVARCRGIPCVSPDWAFADNCSAEALHRHEITLNIIGKEVCITSITSNDRKRIEEICAARNAIFNSTLTKKCVVLVVPDSFIATASSYVNSSNPKIRFAVKNNISLITLKSFIDEYGKRGSASDTAGGSNSRNDIVIGKDATLDSFLVRSTLAAPHGDLVDRSISNLENGSRLSSFHHRGNASVNALEELRSAMEDVVACVSPAWRLHTGDNLIELFTLSGVKFSTELTDRTTHVIILGANCEESIFPRPGLEFVSAEWLRKCLQQERRVSCLPFRVSVQFVPVIVFSSVSATERERLEQQLQSSANHSLRCVLQTSLLLGGPSFQPEQTPIAPPAGGSVCVKGELYKTTHLVVDRDSILSSPKVSALVDFVTHCSDASVCHLVDAQWIVRSLHAGKWLDWEYFTVKLPTREEIDAYWKDTAKSVVVSSPVVPQDVSPADTAKGVRTLEIKEIDNEAEEESKNNIDAISPEPKTAKDKTDQEVDRQKHRSAPVTEVSDAAHTPTARRDSLEEGASQSQHTQADAENCSNRPINKSISESRHPSQASAPCETENFIIPTETVPSLTLEAILTDLEGIKCKDTDHVNAKKGTLSQTTTTASSSTTGRLLRSSTSGGSGSNSLSSYQNNAMMFDMGRDSINTEFVPSSVADSSRVSTIARMTGGSANLVCTSNGNNLFVTASDLLLKRPSNKVPRVESQEVIYAKLDLYGQPINLGLDPLPIQPSGQLVIGGNEAAGNTSSISNYNYNNDLLSSVSEPVLLINKDVLNELDIESLLDPIEQNYRLTTNVAECTHFVVGKLAKTELFLCCLAAGKWIVAPSFLTASSKRKAFVKEEYHEWNVERVQQVCARTSTLLLGKACCKQRKATTRPFVTWQVFLTCSSSARANGFHAVLASGGCTSITHTTTKELTDLARANTWDKEKQPYILSDDNVWTQSQITKFDEECSIEVPILRLEYIVHHMSEDDPNPSEFELLQISPGKKRPRH